MITSFRSLRILTLLLFIHTVFASGSTTERRSRNRVRVLAKAAPETRSLVTRAAPSGWSLYVKSGNDGGGCYVDSETRILNGYSGSSTTNGLESCLNTCRTKGFSYGGVEAGNQCFCGNSLPSNLASAPSSQCNYACKTTTTDKCGGSWRMHIYAWTPPPLAAVEISGYTLKGCYSDSANRVLAAYSFINSKMTIKMCLDTCKSRGFSIAGVESGNQCYCANVANAPTKIDEIKCNKPCPVGDATGCGGAWAMNMYQSGAASTTTAVTTTTTSSAVATTPASTSAPTGWTYVQCGTDSAQRALNGANYLDQGLTVNKCLSYCASKGFTIGGVQVGVECWCGNSLLNGQGKKVAESECQTPCGGDGTKGRCGGDWKISFYSSLTGNALTTAFSTVSTTASTSTSTSTAVPVPTNAPGGSYTPSINIPGSGTKYVWAHFIVGNAYPYTYDTWMNDIRLASASGIDGFALNMGPDSWQPDRIRDAYNAAAASGTNFKMMLSFDIAEFNCGDTSRIGLFQQYLKDYLYHPAAAKVNGKSAVTTFMGQDCSFGQGSSNNGWATVFGANAGNIYYMPAYTSDPRGLGAFNIQAEVNWGSAWPEGGNDINLDRENYFIGLLSQTGKKYVPTISPLFASHMSYKNFIWRGDNWLLAQKFEQLISIRDKVDQVELVSWNDYGESSYIGPIGGDMPSDVRYYVNDKFPHEDILSLVNFYSTAWKTGRWPAITKDQVWVMARPHARYGASGGYGPPAGRDFTQDSFYAQVHLTADATVTLCSGACVTKAGVAGINRFSQPMTAGQGISVEIKRNGQVTTRLNPPFTFQGNADRPNFNYLIKSS